MSGSDELELVTSELSGLERLRVGLISDTHIPEARAELWPQVFDVFDWAASGDAPQTDDLARREMCAVAASAE